MSKKRSPLKAKPLRNPGESLEREIDRLINDRAMAYVAVAMVMVSIALLEWIRWWTGFKFALGTWTVVTTLVVVGVAILVWRTRVRVRRLRQGLDGEKAVGQYLERLRDRGAHVLHDLPGDGFNVDHVVIHPSGVYAVETKTYSKPVKGDAQIVFDGEKVRVAGYEPERDPVRQARACAAWVREQVAETTGKTVTVRPVVVFPGWFIQPTAESRGSDVWVLNPKALPAFIDHSDRVMPDTDVHLLASSLSRHVRSAS
ncbi:nuclease-related domain-containing protein [Thioalkalivibrio sp. ALgr1]|uniref:nuclease-related domain-containing protein n=1 Tax=Thioalkalivibrio sp. ALgr1 TaxID=748655 RepID=UPI001E58F7EF|nr:nuclease-related domain-containing protein [Thioalkalivibrio sp. ALgr1]